MKKLGLLFGIAFVCLCFTTAKAETYYAYLSSAQEVPTNASTGTGYARVVLNESALTVTWNVVFTGLSSNQTASHIHGPSAVGANSGVLINFPAVGGTAGTLSGTAAITTTQIAHLRAGNTYMNIHSANFIGGEIRG
ncbi:MAG: CHRD domain-containing protein, partial [Blastocatellia bacterium]|nr:CHRD domain-containing protein [Blastocatellia bacterium]